MGALAMDGGLGGVAASDMIALGGVSASRESRTTSGRAIPRSVVSELLVNSRGHFSNALVSETSAMSSATLALVLSSGSGWIPLRLLLLSITAEIITCISGGNLYLH